MSQCNVRIGDINFTLLCNYYNSESAYKNYYAITGNGFSIYTIYKDYILFFIEIGKQDELNIMHIDYNTKYTVYNRRNIISDEDFFLFISSIANYFSIIKIFLHCEYITCDLFKIKNLEKINISNQSRPKVQRNFSNINDDNVNKLNNQIDIYGGSYSIDIYNYLTDKKKRYEDSKIMKTELQAKFSYYMLDKLFNSNPSLILRKQDSDELYQIYNKVFKLNFEKENDNLRNFILWIIENKCYLIQDLIGKMNRVYITNNPFENDYYVLDHSLYLYNRGYIKTNPQYLMNFEIKVNKRITNKDKNDVNR